MGTKSNNQYTPAMYTLDGPIYRAVTARGYPVDVMIASELDANEGTDYHQAIVINARIMVPKAFRNATLDVISAIEHGELEL